ncbi:hypothetical protein ACXC9Q_31080 [Kribbella sp. CWNU-51]
MNGVRGGFDISGSWVSAWADVGHSLTRSGSRRVLAGERGIAGIALLGEWPRSGQRPGIAKLGAAGRDVADFQAITIAETLRSSV